MEVIKVHNLSVKYNKVHVVDDISFSVKSGEILGIIGPNGAGKTSTLECIEGLRTYSGGDIKVLDMDLKDRAIYSKIGIQLQETNMPDNLKVIELIKLYQSFYENPADYESLLSMFDLIHAKNVFVKKLSGGQKQKLSIILALIGNPEVLFLDEISTGLDPYARIQIWNTIKILKDKGITILMTTHFMEEAQELCDRVCLMANGKIKAIGTMPELVQQAMLPIKITLEIDTEEVKKINLKELPVYIKAEQMNNKIICYVTHSNQISEVINHFNNKLEMLDIDIDKPNLEDVFFHLTGAKLEIKK